MSCPFAYKHTKEEILADMAEGEGPTKCTWKLGMDKSKSPHTVDPNPKEPKILDDILQRIGNTPLVRINKITKAEGIECEILAKCEYFNAGGSVKDRIGKRMMLDAEASGRIKPGDTIIEPTSGNTGIGLALTCALRGYRCIITMPEKMSREKVDVLKALGAEIIRTPTEAAFDSPDSHIGVAKRLNKEIPNSHILDQYTNPGNPLAHYDGTAEEILNSCDDDIDVCVITAGTGGTISGIARKVKERCPKCKIVGVDPHGSILALPESLNADLRGYQVEGIGYDFIPDVLDRTLIDQWVKSEDKSSFAMSRRLIKEEGLLVGGSAGSAMVAAVNVAKTLKKGQRVVVLFADSVRNYMSKFLNDQWMVERGFMEEEEKNDSVSKEWWASKTVSDLAIKTPHTVGPDVSCQECVDLLSAQGFDQIPCVSEDGRIEGVVTMGNLTSKLISGRVQGKDSVLSVVYKQFHKVQHSTKLSLLSSLLDKNHFCLVSGLHHGAGGSKKETVTGVVTRIDLLSFIIKGEKN